MELGELLKSKYYRTLFRNIVFTILFVSITPMVMVSIFTLDEFRTSYRQKVHENMMLLARKHKKNIDLFLDEKLANIRLLSGKHTYDELAYPPFLRQKLAELQQAYDRVFVDLGVVNDKGIQVAYAGPHDLTNANYFDAGWFKKAIETPYYTSDVFYGLRGAPHFIVAVRHENDGRYWILRATIDFGSFNSLVENLRIGRTGFAFILNREGEFQTKPGAKIRPENNTQLLRNTVGLDEQPYVTTLGDGTGKNIIYASTLLKHGEWMLVLQQDYNDALEELHRTQRIAILIIMAGSLAIVTTALVLVRRLIRRIAIADLDKHLADQEKEMMSQQVIETGKLASIGELAAGIAHEINNPVAIMVEEAGWIQDLLEEEDFKDGQNLQEFQRALRQINTQGKRCKDITHKLLSFARKTDSRIQDVVINEMLDEVVYLSTQRAKYSNISISTDLQENLPIIKASETELQQVFLNLVNNALDAMEKTGGEITVTSRMEKKSVSVTIADTGPGIAEANLARIFDPFFTTKPVGKGTGLGLSICYGIVNKMGGAIDIKSQVGKGTTFIIRIPLDTTKAAAGIN